MDIVNLSRRGKLVAGYFGIVFLGMLSGGCYTQSLIEDSKLPNTCLFNPSAVYQTTNADKVALEGMYSNSPPTVYTGTPRFHGYIIFFRTNASPMVVSTNANKSLIGLEKFPAQVALHLKPKSKLPAGYEKVVNLPPNGVTIKFDETHPNRPEVLLVPFAFVVDIICLPVEIPVFIAVANYHGC